MTTRRLEDLPPDLNKQISSDQCVSKIQQVTRNYVKRQHTWWKSSNLKIYKKFDQFPDEIDVNSINLDLI